MCLGMNPDRLKPQEPCSMAAVCLFLVLSAGARSAVQQLRTEISRADRQEIGAPSPNFTNTCVSGTTGSHSPDESLPSAGVAVRLVPTSGISGPAMAAAAAVTGKLKETRGRHRIHRDATSPCLPGRPRAIARNASCKWLSQSSTHWGGGSGEWISPPASN